MKECNLTIDYIEKDTGEHKEKIITIDIGKYQSSFSDDEFHLSQNYSPSMVKKELTPIKVDYLTSIINEKFKFNEKPKYNIKSIIKEVDDDISEQEEEY